MKYELVVLGFLLDRPMYGYQLNQEVKMYRMDSWAKISPPMVYKTLIKLHQNNLIISHTEKKGLMPERKVYRLTEKGNKRLADLVERSLMDKNLTNDLSNLGYFFIFALPKEKAMECLVQKKANLERAIKSMNKRLENFRGKTPINRFLVIEKDLDRFQSELSHLNQLIYNITICTEWNVETFVDKVSPVCNETATLSNISI
jgi:DNA-binding PadR family transcriptional regulator